VAPTAAALISPMPPAPMVAPELVTPPVVPEPVTSKFYLYSNRKRHGLQMNRHGKGGKAWAAAIKLREVWRNRSYYARSPLAAWTIEELDPGFVVRTARSGKTASLQGHGGDRESSAASHQRTKLPKLVSKGD
jgi:hypothetical protein